MTFYTILTIHQLWLLLLSLVNFISIILNKKKESDKKWSAETIVIQFDLLMWQWLSLVVGCYLDNTDRYCPCYSQLGVSLSTPSLLTTQHNLRCSFSMYTCWNITIFDNYVAILSLYQISSFPLRCFVFICEADDIWHRLAPLVRTRLDEGHTCDTAGQDGGARPAADCTDDTILHR